MIIDMPNEKIEQMVKEQVNEAIRKRIKEMQGDYTSKAYIEKLIRDIIWDKIFELCPDIEEYIQSEIRGCIDSALKDKGNLKLTKKQLVEQIVEGLLEKL